MPGDRAGPQLGFAKRSPIAAGFGNPARVPDRIDDRPMVMHGHAMARKKISTTIYITPEQNEQLKLLHAKTKVPVAEYIRQGIDLVLDKERHNLPGQLVFPSGK